MPSKIQQAALGQNSSRYPLFENDFMQHDSVIFTLHCRRRHVLLLLTWLIDWRSIQGRTKLSRLRRQYNPLFISAAQKKKKLTKFFFLQQQPEQVQFVLTFFSIELWTGYSRSAYLCLSLIIMFRWITATHATGSKSKSMAKSKYSLYFPKLNSVHDVVTSIEPLLKPFTWTMRLGLLVD